MPWSSPVPIKAKGAFTVPTPQGAVSQLAVPPTGINQVDNLSQMPQTDAVFMYNCLSARYGTKVRTGYTQWTLNVNSGGVKTIVPYIGSLAANDRLFGTSPVGIYNLTTSGASPLLLAFPSGATSRSGMGIWTANTTAAGFFTCYCDEENGYYLYTESTDTWAKVTTAQVTGVDPGVLCFVLPFKSKLWFIQRDTSDAWYLPTGAIFGAAVKFSFGNKFRHGGTLQALYTWTLDGGIGVDDYLVAISSTGEVIIYKGDDPSDATNFSQVGSWFIGQVPAGRRIAGTFGGDLYMLSVYGLLPISKLIQTNVEQIDTIELTRKISPAIRAKMLQTVSTPGWEVKLVPSENTLIVMSPKQVGQTFTQYTQSLNAQGWSVYQDMPMFNGEVWHGIFYFGGLDGNVYTHTGSSDNLNLNTGASVKIQASLLTSFQDYAEPGVQHRAMFIRPVFLTSAAPTYSCSVRYDYNISEVLGVGTPVNVAGSLWDNTTWDVGIWTGESVEIEAISGGSGLGRAMAVALNLTVATDTTLIRFDIAYDSGGFM